MTTIRAFTQKIRALFSNFKKKGRGDLPHPLSGYAPVLLLPACCMLVSYQIFGKNTNMPKISGKKLYERINQKLETLLLKLLK